MQKNPRSGQFKTHRKSLIELSTIEQLTIHRQTPGPTEVTALDLSLYADRQPGRPSQRSAPAGAARHRSAGAGPGAAALADGAGGPALDDTEVDDLTPLAGLVHLRRLSLSGTGVTDLSPLAGLTSLRELSLDRTSVSDLNPLSGLESLEELTLTDTAIDPESVAELRSRRPNLSVVGTDG